MGRNPLQIYIHNCGTIRYKELLVDSTYFIITESAGPPMTPVRIVFITDDGTTSDNVDFYNGTKIKFADKIRIIKIKNLAIGTPVRIGYSDSIITID